MAAIHAVLAAFPGGAVALPDDLYHGVMTLIDTVLGPWGLKVVRYAADGGTAAVEKALDEAVALAGADKALLWLETPSNPLLRIVDIAAACEAARSRGVASAVDATWLTPVLCRPLDLGADVVVHSVRDGGTGPRPLAPRLRRGRHRQTLCPVRARACFATSRLCLRVPRRMSSPTRRR